MNQKNSGILDNKWLRLSSVESEDFGLTFPEDPIRPQDPIGPDPGDPILPGDPIFPQNPIDPGSDHLIGLGNSLDPSIGDPISQEYPINPGNPINRANLINPGSPLPGNPIGFDLLTGNPPLNNNRPTALYNAGLHIDLSTGMPNHARVTATVKVELSKNVRYQIREDLVDFVLQSSLWGIDGNPLNGNNDNLLYFPDQKVTGEGTYTFSKIVHFSVLDEDHSFLNDDDEIAASISIVSLDPTVPLNIQTMTPIVYGKF